MTSQIKISVIVPVYKAEKYLRKCVDSILAQTFRDFEVLLVDDGSPDKSGAICDEYAGKDPRVRVFHKENGGVSSARNKGIDEARGEWITFVDADDWLPEDALTALYFKTSGVDIVQGIVVREDGIRVFAYSKTEVMSSKEWIGQMLRGKYHSGPSAKLIRRGKITVSVFDIPEDIVYGEDLVANIKMAVRCERVAVITDIVYVYRRNLSSVSHTFCYTMPYGERLFSLSLESLRKIGLTENDREVKAFYLNILKHVLSSRQYAGTHPFVTSYFPKIRSSDMLCAKDVVWLWILRNRLLRCLYSAIRK